MSSVAALDDRYSKAVYLPSVVPGAVRPEEDVFALIPYLCRLRLSPPRLVYQPPTMVELCAAGAIPVAPLAESHRAAPTITLCVEAAPYGGHYRELLPATHGALRPPEREALEALAEEADPAARSASDQEYWSEEYWRAMEDAEADAGGDARQPASAPPPNRPTRAAPKATPRAPSPPASTTARRVAGGLARRAKGISDRWRARPPPTAQRAVGRPAARKGGRPFPPKDDSSHSMPSSSLPSLSAEAPLRCAPITPRAVAAPPSEASQTPARSTSGTNAPNPVVLTDGRHIASMEGSTGDLLTPNAPKPVAAAGVIGVPATENTGGGKPYKHGTKCCTVM